MKTRITLIVSTLTIIVCVGLLAFAVATAQSSQQQYSGTIVERREQFADFNMTKEDPILKLIHEQNSVTDATVLRVINDVETDYMPRALYVDDETQFLDVDWYMAYVKYELEVAKDMTHIVTYEKYTEICRVWRKKIPSKFLYAIVNESLKQDVPINYIYAISKIETVNYKFFESLVTNKNGTIDIGLMGINSCNIDPNTENGRRFLQTHFYFDDEYETFDRDDQLHILKLGVNYIKWLVSYTGDFSSACKAYNGGLTRLLKNKTPAASISYSRKAVRLASEVGMTTIEEDCFANITLLAETSDEINAKIEHDKSMEEFYKNTQLAKLNPANTPMEHPILTGHMQKILIRQEDYYTTLNAFIRVA